MCYSVLQHLAVCRSVLQGIAVCDGMQREGLSLKYCSVLKPVPENKRLAIVIKMKIRIRNDSSESVSKVPFKKMTSNILFRIPVSILITKSDNWENGLISVL